MAEKAESKLVSLPISRIKTIMKTSPEVSSIGQEAILLVAKATELFIADFAQKAHERETEGAKKLAYRDLAEVVGDTESMQFLADILPPKIVALDYIRARKAKAEEEAAKLAAARLAATSS
ncbi:chromatin accessibility complex protein 1-like [Glandiceps talaboti]